MGFLLVPEQVRYNRSRLNLAMGLVLAINSYSPRTFGWQDLARLSTLKLSMQISHLIG